MAGPIQSWPARIIGACHVAVAGGVATMVSSLGGIASVTRNSAGNLTVTLRAPGVPFATGHTPILVVTPIAVAFANVTATLASSTTVGVFTFDAAGAALDNVSFTLVILSSARTGGA